MDERGAGLIDQASDALPMLQRLAGPEEAAMGRSDRGFCRGPITGRTLSALVQDRYPGPPLEPFHGERFDGGGDAAKPITLHG